MPKKKFPVAEFPIEGLSVSMETIIAAVRKVKGEIAARRHGRVTPYTEAGIRRLPCVRCGQRASFQWSACSDGNLWRPLCLDCDIELNRLVVFWMGDPNAKSKADRYELNKRTLAEIELGLKS